MAKWYRVTLPYGSESEYLAAMRLAVAMPRGVFYEQDGKWIVDGLLTPEQREKLALPEGATIETA